ncbi:MAG: ATP-binding cassette domain-containing protein, partial [Planctomycetota bacterium]
MAKLLEAKALVKYYSGRAVVDHASFDVDSGESVGMLGPNGAGKTTAFRMCVGLIRPASGSVFLSGEDITSLPMHQR